MSWWYLIVSWIHLLGAIFWVGGMLFLSMVAVPLLKRSEAPDQAQRWFLVVARRFRTLVWVAIVILVLTGGVLLSQHLTLSLPLSEWPSTIIVKLTLVLLLIFTSVAHDRIIGPKVRNIKQQVSEEWTKSDRALVQAAPWIGRITTLLGVAVACVGVVLVRS